MTSLSDDQIRFFSLRAAAKVALTMSTASVFAGCGGSVGADTPAKGDDTGSGSGADTATKDTGTTVVPDTFVVADAIVDATSCGTVDPDAATAPQVTCCAAQVNANYPETDGAVPPPEPDPDAGVSPGLVDCCAAVLGVWSMSSDPDAADTGTELGLSRMQVFDCCGIVPNSYERFPAACMAWGPPMPVEMNELEVMS